VMEARTFPARFNGPCAADCGEGIEKDEEVKWVNDGQRDRVVHAGCELIQAGKLEAGTVCQKCWTERSVAGACACDPD
jgi:hypothetical protein